MCSPLLVALYCNSDTKAPTTQFRTLATHTHKSHMTQIPHIPKTLNILHGLFVILNKCTSTSYFPNVTNIPTFPHRTSCPTPLMLLMLLIGTTLQQLRNFDTEIRELLGV
jgi:hypothetical protein